MCVVPILQNAITGLRAVDLGALQLARSVDASAAEVVWRLRLPSALPYLFVAARTSVGLALVGAAFGEFFAKVPKGLGQSVNVALVYNLKLQLFGSAMVLAFMGSLATAAVNAVQRVLVPRR